MLEPGPEELDIKQEITEVPVSDTTPSFSCTYPYEYVQAGSHFTEDLILKADDMKTEDLKTEDLKIEYYGNTADAPNSDFTVHM